MKWTWIVLIVLLVWLVICILVKLHLKKKLDDIDGLGSVASKRPDKSNINVIASFGNCDPDQIINGDEENEQNRGNTEDSQDDENDPKGC